MTLPGNNGSDPGQDINYTNVVLDVIADVARFLELGLEDVAADTAQAVAGALMETPPANRAAVYTAAKQAIASLPAEFQAMAYTFCQITPDAPDDLEALARAAGVEETPKEERPRPQLVPDVPVINPALDYAGGIVYIAQQMTIAGEDGETIKSMPMIFTSKRDYFPPPFVKGANEIKVLETKVAIDKTMDRAARRWSLAAIQDFLQGLGQVDPWLLYHRLERVFIEHIWFAEPGNYMILALYTMLSYVFPIFDAVPYLHFTGLAGSGKTHAARLLATLAFNGHIEVDPTEASLFRTIEATRGLVVLDDQETGVTNRSHSENPFMTILKTGYKSGSRVTRMERRGNEFMPLTFDVFCPKVITNVFGLEDILADRVIPILMREIPPGKQSSVNTSPISSAEAQPLIDDLFLFAMLHTSSLFELAGSQTRHQSRTEEIFWPLFVLATYCDMHSPETERSLLAELSEILEEKKGQRRIHKEETPEARLRLALLNLLEERGVQSDWFSTREIEREFYKLHSSPPDWYNDRWLGRNIGKVLKVRDADKRRHWKDETVPRFDYRTGQELDQLETKRFTYYFVRREAL